ncbi:MAG: phospholipase [Verrucomicrobia bacterium]|nr:phospholipase [Verrucomicrobiota bacterium]
MKSGEQRAESVARMAERRRIVASFKVFGVPREEQAEILEAIDSPAWDWFRDCDGCTCVSESYWPTKFFPPCLRHDFDWFVGHSVWESNRRFYRLSRRYRMTRLRAGWRFVGVTLGWYGFFKWRRMWRRRRGAEVGGQKSEVGGRTCAGCGRGIDPNEFPGVNEAGQWLCTACEEKQAEERVREERGGEQV